MALSRRAMLIAVCLIGLLTEAALAQPGPRLLVHAGAGLRPALDELGKRFEKKTGAKVTYNYKGSACLLPDVVMSGKGDVYMPGELYYVKQAVDRKLVKPQYRAVATMATVIIVQPGNPKNIKGLADLAKPGIRLGLGDPKAVAIGRAAKQSLEKAKLWDKVQKNRSMSALNVTELGNAVKLKHLDAAIVWDSCAALYGSSDMMTVAIAPQYRVVSVVPAAVVAASTHAREAQQYVDFLASPEATKVFAKHGYGAPPKSQAGKTGQR